MSKGLFVALALSCLTGGALAQNSPQERLIRSRAVESVIWAMPAVNYDLMLQEMLSKTDGKVNQVIYWGRPLDWRNQTLTPNPDAIYFMAFFNTKDGPIVLDLPPGDTDGSFNANIVNVWQMPLEDAGLLGADKGKGGKYLILPPGYADKAPDGYVALQSDTFGGYMLFRSNLKSHNSADVARSIDYGKRFKVYPLAQASSPAPTIFTDAKDVTFDSTIRYDASFFEHLDRIVQSEPWLQRDRAMIDPLKSLGIEKGKPFKPDDASKALLTAATREAHAGWKPNTMPACRRSFPRPAAGPIRRLPEFVKAAQEAYADPNLYPVDSRGIAYSYAYIGIKRLGAGQFYLISIKDKDGAVIRRRQYVSAHGASQSSGRAILVGHRL